MIQKLDIAGVHTHIGDDLKKYVNKKIGGLDRYVTPASRESLHADVKLKESNKRGKQERTCEVILHLPHEVITAVETTDHLYAAIDLAEDKLKAQLKKYKELHSAARFHRRVLSKLKHRPAEDSKI